MNNLYFNFPEDDDLLDEELDHSDTESESEEKEKPTVAPPQPTVPAPAPQQRPRQVHTPQVNPRPAVLPPLGPAGVLYDKCLEEGRKNRTEENSKKVFASYFAAMNEASTLFDRMIEQAKLQRDARGGGGGGTGGSGGTRC